MKISRNKCSSFLLLSVVFSALLLSGMTQALQYEANFKVAYRYSSLGLQLAVIQPDTDGDYRNYLAQRYVYGDINRPSLVTQIESGNLERWLDDSIQPKDWTNYTSFTIYSTRGFEYDNYGRKIKEWIKGTNGTIEMLSQYTYNAKGLVQCKARRMNKAVYSSLLFSACSQSTAGSEGPDRITRYTYDELDQVLTEERGVGAGVLQQVYVTNTYEGKLLRTQTDANGNKTSLIYDSYDRLQKAHLPIETD
ncbi:MAG: hypothetical protein IPK77_11720 [Cellvibrio sp.]|nr:hypothetical protein [Cellvibrio sp.]